MQQQIQQDRANKRGKKLKEDLKLKICDLGNGCWTYHHFSTEIQTRQYRSPEVIIGSKYNETADNWSLACMLFEMATGDFLFEPRNSSNKKYTQDDDHIAQMMELLGPIPKSLALQGIHYKKMFDRDGQLKNIKGLNYWPLQKVLHEKYKFKPEEAKDFADFLLPMLEWDPEKRAKAKTMLEHPWLKKASNYDTKLNEEEIQELYQRNHLEKQKKEMLGKDFEDGPVVETSRLCLSDLELNKGDDEMSTNSNSFGALSFLSSEDDDSLERPSKAKKGKKNGKKKKEEALFLKRDIAEGRTFNNSFTGPYPEETDHLHLDKGANP